MIIQLLTHYTKSILKLLIDQLCDISRCNTQSMDYGQFEFEPDQLLLPSLVTLRKYRPNPILYRLGFNFNGAARLFTVPGLS